MAPANSTMPQDEQPAGVAAQTPVSSLTTPKPRMQNRNEQYQRAQVETASPTRLIILLYDGAIRFCTQAIEAMAQGLLERQNTNLIKAQAILAELMGSLKRDVGGEMTDNLFRLYSHMRDQLVEANVYDRMEPVKAVLQHLYELRETWIEVERLTMTGVAVSAPSADPLANKAVATVQPAAKTMQPAANTGSQTVTPVKPQETTTRTLRLGNISA
jgi:flagellar protein FliS